MKCTIILAALPLVCTASPAFVGPARGPAALETNRPKLGDVSSRPSAIAPQQRPARTQQRQRRRGRQLEASLGGAGTPSVAVAVASSASFVLAWSPTALGAVFGVLLGASVVNALQGGVRGDLGSTPDKILGVPAEEATAEHVAKLGALVLGRLLGGFVFAEEHVQPKAPLLIMKFQLVAVELLNFSAHRFTVSRFAIAGPLRPR